MCIRDSTTLSGFNSRIVATNTEGVGQSTDGAGALHLLYASYTYIARVAANAVASSLISTAGADVIQSVPAIGANGGPKITWVQQISSTVYNITVTHDGGTDVIVPSLAANGIGFAVMDGGSPASPGTIINARACVRLDATHIQITLSSAPSNGVASLRLYYPYGNLPGTWTGQQPDAGRIGVGCVVTDNAASIMAADANGIANQLNTAWAVNFPIAATTYGLPVSSSPG